DIQQDVESMAAQVSEHSPALLITHIKRLGCTARLRDPPSFRIPYVFQSSEPLFLHHSAQCPDARIAAAHITTTDLNVRTEAQKGLMFVKGKRKRLFSKDGTAPSAEVFDIRPSGKDGSGQKGDVTRRQLHVSLQNNLIGNTERPTQCAHSLSVYIR